MKAVFSRFFPPAALSIPAVVSGVLVTLSFPTVQLGWLAFVALTPVLSAFARVKPTGREAFRTGFLFGGTCYLTMLWWIVKLIPTADVTIPWLMTPALVILVLYLAVYPAFFFLILSSVTRYRRVALLLMAPALWVLLEGVRARSELGFPWGSMGYALSYTPPLIQGAAFGGLPFLSFLVVAVNALFAVLFDGGRVRVRAIAGFAGVAIIAATWGFGQYAMSTANTGATRPVRVSVVQPNVDLALKWKPEFRDSTLRLIQRLTHEAAASGAELIIFPETSAPVYIDGNRVDSRTYRDTLSSLARTTGVPLFIGFLDYRRVGTQGDVNIYNSSGVFRPDGTYEKYAKMHLLPFGEALPGSQRFRWLRKINFGQANFEPGEAHAPIRTGPLAITPLICFESVFPDLCERGVRGGTELLVNITNDGWFADTPGPYQHAQMSVLRAVEFRRWLVRSANTGVSMVVSPTGEVKQSLPLFEEGILTANVGALSGQTFYALHGDRTVLFACLVLGAVAALVGRRPRAT